ETGFAGQVVGASDALDDTPLARCIAAARERDQTVTDQRMQPKVLATSRKQLRTAPEARRERLAFSAGIGEAIPAAANKLAMLDHAHVSLDRQVGSVERPTRIASQPALSDFAIGPDRATVLAHIDGEILAAANDAVSSIVDATGQTPQGCHRRAPMQEQTGAAVAARSEAITLIRAALEDGADRLRLEVVVQCLDAAVAPVTGLLDTAYRQTGIV